jgi:AcrR family transcriptional regulator
MPATIRLPARERLATIERAAEQLFAERGYDGTRIEDIVAAAGVTKPVLYRHFASKKALHRALLEHHRAALAAAALDEYVADRPLEDRTALMLDAWFAYVEGHPYAWRMLLRDTTGDPELQELHRELQDRQRAADAALLREALPDVADDLITPLAEVVRSSLTGLALWWLDHPEVERRILVATMLDVVAGILTRHRTRAATLPIDA